MSASRLLRLRGPFTTIATLASLGIGPSLLAACGGHAGGPSGPATDRITGQTDYLSAPLPGTGSSSFGATDGAGGATAAPSAPGAGHTTSTNQTVTRSVQETDLYRLEGDRLYYLNAYRGLMVFDVSNVDAPKLIGRSPIFGDPQEMIVQNGFAVVVVGDWYGQMEDGTPFHGSIVRGLDASDPSNIKVVGEAKLGGWVRDTRVVGNVLYTVSEDYGWVYGWEYGWSGYYGGPMGGGGVAMGAPSAGGGSGTVSGGGVGTGSAASGPKVGIASVRFDATAKTITSVGSKTFDGYGGIFNVTPSSIMLAHQHSYDPNAPYNPNQVAQTDLQYVDISDPNGAIALRGSLTVNGAATGWGPDNGRWNLDFADGATAHTLGCGAQYCGNGSNDKYVLSTVDFTNPDKPALASELSIAGLGWSAAARFSGNRLYLSPSDYNYNANGQTPLAIYDLTSKTAPKLTGTTNLPGSIWMYIPDGTRLFSIGSQYSSTNNGPYGSYGSSVSVQYVDVSDATAPKVIGSSTFGQGWAWTPAASTFKAFTFDDTKGMAVIPFSGWDYTGRGYTNGVQLIQYTPAGITGAGAAHTKGWVERGIFVKNRVVSLSDMALSVVDYTNASAPRVVSELTLARNVVNARPQNGTIAELSSDWWDNDTTQSEMRVLPIANAEETSDNGQGVSVNIDGVNARIFQNGDLAYVVTSVQHPAPCNEWNGYYGPGNTGTGCTGWSQQVQVVDTSNGGAKLRGKIQLPDLPYNGGWGWYGCWYYDWFDGSDIVQVDGDALAFRRWFPQYAYTPSGYQYIDSLDALYVVDLKNADAPNVASLTITDDTTSWWGNMKAVGSKLYTTHYEWITRPDPTKPGNSVSYVKYFLDDVDLTDRAHPRVGAKINVPGALVGASSTDPSILYMIDYRWDGNHSRNDLDVVKIDGGKAYLQSQTTFDGWVGNVIVKNDRAYMSAQEYEWNVQNNARPFVELHQVDLSNVHHPVDRVSTSKDNGWGWLLAVEGDRAIVTSGWGPVGVDIYKLSDSAAPAFDRSVRTRGWWTESIARQDQSLFLSSGYWGVQRINLQ